MGSPLPEGDTIHKVAAAMAPRLVGQRLARLEWGAPRGGPRRPLAPGSIEAVYAHGKHLLVQFGNGRSLRSHLGMHGSWHRYPPGAPWRRPDHQARILLGTRSDLFVCFNPRDVEWLRGNGIRPTNLFHRLGPDLLAPGLDIAEVVHRAREFCEPDAPLVDVLLDQRAACGIGNVYKSELLFIERQPPLARLRDTPDGALRAMFQLGARLLGRNLHGGRRRTRFVDDGRGRLWVYGRGSAPCLECGTALASARLGREHRATYWCPRCQSATGAPSCRSSHSLRSMPPE